jgi:hypothetical protein
VTDEVRRAFRHLERLLMAAAATDPNKLDAATGDVMASDVTRET